MVGTNRWRTVAKTLLALGLVVILSLSSDGVGSTAQAALRGRSRIADPSQSAIKSSGKIAEASPPSALQELRQALDDYQPQVTILSPKKNEVLPDNTVSVRFLVKDLPIFKNETFGLGPHLHVLLDNRPYQAVYDLKQPLVLNDLEPGTHTIRAFASRPWHESFKNEGAFAQITFHVLTKTQDNSPDPDQPLLTYSRPQGVYGAEPILLDFYLTNVPLHLVAQADANDDIADWRIRCTVNGDRFVLDRWQPIYLKGFKPGKNWVQLEYLDNNGNPIKNVFNNTVRVVDYQPNGADTLAKLVRGDLSAADVRGIVDPNYVPAPPPSPTPTITLTPTPKPSSSPLEPPQPESAPSLKEPRPDAIAPLSPTPAPTITPTPEPPPEVRTPAPSVKPPVTEPLPSPSETVPFAPAFAPSEPVAEPKSEELTLEEQTLEEQTPNEQTVPTEPAAPAPEATKARKPTSSREQKSNATRVRRSTKAAPLSWQERLRQFQERLSRAPAPAPSPSVSTPSVPTPDLPSTLPEIINPSSPEVPFSQPEAPTLDERSSR